MEAFMLKHLPEHVGYQLGVPVEFQACMITVIYFISYYAYHSRLGWQCVTNAKMIWGIFKWKRVPHGLTAVLSQRLCCFQ